MRLTSLMAAIVVGVILLPLQTALACYWWQPSADYDYEPPHPNDTYPGRSYTVRLESVEDTNILEEKKYIFELKGQIRPDLAKETGVNLYYHKGGYSADTEFTPFDENPVLEDRGCLVTEISDQEKTIECEFAITENPEAIRYYFIQFRVRRGGSHCDKYSWWSDHIALSACKIALSPPELACADVVKNACNYSYIHEWKDICEDKEVLLPQYQTQLRPGVHQIITIPEPPAESDIDGDGVPDC